MKLAMICFLVISSLLSYRIDLIAQDNPVKIDIIPPPPNAASLAKFGDIPVSYYSGLPNIGIPVYTITTPNFQIPISLNYHASGIRVEEIASNVGLGWALSAGGSITRTIRGLPDDEEGGFLFAPDIPSSTGSIHFPLFEKFANGELDSQPDIFHFNINGRSGKFVLGQNDELLIIPRSKIKIEKEFGLLTHVTNAGTISKNQLIKFKITTEDGTKYFFENLEFSLNDQIEIEKQSPPRSEWPEPSVATWHLSRIEAPFNNETINFEYEGYEVKYEQTSVETKYYIYGGMDNSTVVNETELKGKRLSRISFKGGYVNFETSPDNLFRCDFVGDKPLKKITINDGRLRKEFEFIYKYFDNNQIVNYTGCSSTANHDLKKRLILSEVKEYPRGKGVNPLPPLVHKFEYNEAVFLPERNSKSQDHWGFYNGKHNLSLVPRKKEKIDLGYNNVVYGDYGLADREPNPETSQAGLLETVIYPTGGSTRFEFENNNCQSDELPNNLSEVSIDMDGADNNFQEYQFSFDLINDPFEDIKFFVFNIPFDDTNCKINLKITGLNDNIIYYQQSFSKNGNLKTFSFRAIKGQVPNGRLRVTLWSTFGCIVDDPYLIRMSYKREIPTLNKFAGGVRIKKIISRTGEGTDSSLEQYFAYKSSDGNSSGSVVSFPSYGYIHLSGALSSPSIHFVKTTGTNVPLGLTQGGVVGYSKVTRSQTNNASGKTDYEFTSPKNYPDYFSNFQQGAHFSSHSYPFAPPESNEWKRGLLTKEVTYKVDETNLKPTQHFKKIKKKEISYDLITLGVDEVSSIPGIKVGRGGSSAGSYDVRFYKTSGGVPLMSKEIETVYTDEGDSLKTENNYHYDNNYNLERKDFRNSNDELLISKKYYPYNYYNVPSNGAISSLNSKGILTTIVAEEEMMVKDGISFLMAGKINTFSSFTNHGIILPSKTYILNSSKPLHDEINGFDPNNVLRDTDYYKEEISYISYNQYGSIKSFARKGERKSFIYDYDQMLPVAQVVNASETEIAYTSFETSEKGGWIFNNSTETNQQNLAKTGNRYCVNTTQSSINTGQLPPGTYKVSLWARKISSTNATVSINLDSKTVSSYEWVPLDWEVTLLSSNSIMIELAQGLHIDEIRLHPLNAHMTTYTYDPGVGLTSGSDVNGNTSYYKYDDFGRLINIRDNELNILQTNEYHYRE